MHYPSGEAVDTRHIKARAAAVVIDMQPATARRKALRCTAILTLSGSHEPLVLKTSHVAEVGICVLHDAPLPPKQAGEVTLSVLVDGKVQKLSASCLTGMSACVGNGFRIGLTFTQLHHDAAALISRLLRS